MGLASLLKLDILAEVAFQTRPDGRRVFFPYGLLTRGFIVDSAEAYRQLFFLQKWWSIVILVIAVGLGVLEIPWQQQLPWMVILNLLQYASIRRVTRTLPVSEVRFGIQDFTKNLSLPLPFSPVALCSLVMLGLASVLAGAALCVLEPMIWPTAMFLMLIGIALLYFCARVAKEGAP